MVEFITFLSAVASFKDRNGVCFPGIQETHISLLLIIWLYCIGIIWNGKDRVEKCILPIIEEEDTVC